MSDDPVGNLPSESPAGSEGTPAQGDQKRSYVGTEGTSGVDNHGASPQDQGKHHNQEPHRSSRFAKLRNYFPSADAWVALFTGLLVIETFMTIKVLRTTDKALHKTAEATDQIRILTEADDRAWIASLSPDLIGRPVTGEAVHIMFKRQNVGRSPGTSVKISNLFDTIPTPQQHDLTATEIAPDDFCKTNVPAREIGISYPNSGQSTTLLNSNPIVWDEELNTGRKILRARACISYVSFEKPRETWACYLFLPETAPVAGQQTTPGVVTYFTVSDCRGGQGGT